MGGSSRSLLERIVNRDNRISDFIEESDVCDYIISRALPMMMNEDEKNCISFLCDCKIKEKLLLNEICFISIFHRLLSSTHRIGCDCSKPAPKPGD